MHDEYQIEGASFKYTDEEKKFIKKTKKVYNIDISIDQIRYRRSKKAELKEIFPQEYPENDVDCFLSSGNPFFDLMVVKDRLVELKSPIEQTDMYKIYKKVDITKKYVCGADTAEGIGNDFSTAAIYELNTMQQVAVLKCNLKPSEFAKALYDFCSLYKTWQKQFPKLAVERNNHGHAVLLELGASHLNYPNLFYDRDGRAGWLTSSVTRPIMLNGFKDLLENTPQCLYDKQTLNECLTFINNNGKIEAIQGENDDLIIANSIAAQLVVRFSTKVDYPVDDYGENATLVGALTDDDQW